MFRDYLKLDNKNNEIQRKVSITLTNCVRCFVFAFKFMKRCKLFVSHHPAKAHITVIQRRKSLKFCVSILHPRIANYKNASCRRTETKTFPFVQLHHPLKWISWQKPNFEALTTAKHRSRWNQKCISEIILPSFHLLSFGTPCGTDSEQANLTAFGQY